jgi:hypothetical protein
MAPLDYERLLAAVNLAHYHPKWGFTILADRWKMFIEGHHFYTSKGTGSFEVDTKKLDINACILGVSAKHRAKVHVIRIGVSTDLSNKKNEMQKYSDGQLIATPPRLNGLRIKQQSFRQFMEHNKWNYVILGHQCTNGSTNAKTFTSPDNLDLFIFNLSTVLY